MINTRLYLLLFTALVGIIFAPPLRAQSNLGSNSGSNLDCRVPQTQSAMNQCAGLDYRRADEELNRIYRQLSRNLTNPRREQLTAVQLSWLQFRDDHCEFVSSRYAGGSIQPLILQDCLAQVTRSRTEQLKTLLAQSEE
jgi:uncharacterized protein YecT (DUF1311 family)